MGYGELAAVTMGSDIAADCLARWSGIGIGMLPLLAIISDGPCSPGCGEPVTASAGTDAPNLALDLFQADLSGLERASSRTVQSAKGSSTSPSFSCFRPRLRNQLFFFRLLPDGPPAQPSPTPTTPGVDLIS